MKHGTEQRGGKMKAFIIILFTVFMVMAMNTGDWLAYVLVMIGFAVMMYYMDELE
jgi:hypothetical protein